MRGVKCYDKNGTTSYSCSRAKRPTTVQSCPILSCRQSTMSGVHLLIDLLCYVQKQIVQRILKAFVCYGLRSD